MPKITIKKETKKEIKPVKPIEHKEYKLSIKLNDKEFKTETNNLIETIMLFKPLILRTRVIFNIKKGKQEVEKVLTLQQAKMMFRSKVGVEILIKRLIWK